MLIYFFYENASIWSIWYVVFDLSVLSSFQVWYLSEFQLFSSDIIDFDKISEFILFDNWEIDCYGLELFGSECVIPDNTLNVLDFWRFWLSFDRLTLYISLDTVKSIFFFTCQLMSSEQSSLIQMYSLLFTPLIALTQVLSWN